MIVFSLPLQEDIQKQAARAPQPLGDPVGDALIHIYIYIYIYMCFV